MKILKITKNQGFTLSLEHTFFEKPQVPPPFKGSFALIFPRFFFLIFHNTVIIYNTRNRRNDTKKSQKEKKDLF